MQLSSIVESLLLASEEPLPTEEIARIVRAYCAEVEDAHARDQAEGQETPALPDWLEDLSTTSAESVRQAVLALNEQYAESSRAFTISERPKGWKLYTLPAYGNFVNLLFPGRKPERLSTPAMETLAIIAYRQPITKSAIEAVRGVSCDGMMQKLLDRNLVRIGGRAELPGRPLLYETTDLFFDHFGIRSIDDLPNASELRKVSLPEPQDESSNSGSKQLALGEKVASPEPDTDATPEESDPPA